MFSKQQLLLKNHYSDIIGFNNKNSKHESGNVLTSRYLTYITAPMIKTDSRIPRNYVFSLVYTMGDKILYFKYFK